MDYQTLKDFAGPVATIIAALSAVSVTGYFARRQWRTAKDKLLLDLFDKRFDIYDELRTAVARRHDPTGSSDFARAASRARFLFGHKVQTFLEQIQQDLDLGRNRFSEASFHSQSPRTEKRQLTLS